MFSDALLDHFQNPRNAGELPGADAKVEVSNPVCGDVLQLAVRIEGERIVEARFLCRGCTTSIDRKSTRLNSSHQIISYAVFCLKKKKTNHLCYLHPYARCPPQCPHQT